MSSVRPILRDGQKQYSKRTGEPLWRLVYDTDIRGRSVSSVSHHLPAPENLPRLSFAA